MKTTNTHYYFGYGLNTNLHSMAYRCPGAATLGHAVLPGYRFRFAYHADVVADKAAITDGVLWRISDEHLNSLDCLEGWPRYYDRRVVTVQCDGQNYDAWAYYMQPGNQDCWPSEGYLDCLIEGYQQNNVPTRQLHETLLDLDTRALQYGQSQVNPNRLSKSLNYKRKDLYLEI